MPPVVSLNNILVLQGDSFKLSVEHLVLQPGLIYALTGANGSGKSTLLRVMALLTPPFEGTIEFSGNKTNNPARQRQKVTLVEQSPYLFKGKVIDNLSYGLKLRGIDNNERIRRITTTLANVGLEGFEQRQAKELSGGEIQRVALARALALKPELLLLDEPTANIDSSSLQGYEALLRDLPKYGVTVVFSTHDPSQSQRLGDQVLHLDNGRLLSSLQQRLDERSNLYGT
ncbi:MAG: energy-coupling factor ABC transporter ATP-binding protein [Desulfuromonadales bacterium]|nr:energy-coupling factor ABC transporter ATP-binding protein [Desulfuromonadales bacterium]